MHICFVELTQNHGDRHGLTFLFLSSFLKKNFPNIKVTLADINYDDVTEKIKSSKPDIIGISSFSEQYPGLIRFVKKLKTIKELSNTPIIIGGIHISTLPSSFHPVFDVGVLNDGEYTLLELLQHYDKHKNLKDIEYIKGIMYFKNDVLVKTSPREIFTNIDNMPLPDYSILNPHYFDEKPVYDLSFKARKADMITSRGCPFKCIFCAATMFNKKYRAYSAENVFKIIQNLHLECGVQVITINDDLFTASVPRLQELYRLLSAAKLIGKIKYRVWCRADTFTDETALLLKKLGVISIVFGFESGSEPTLQFLKSNTVTVEENRKAVLVAERHKIKTIASIIIGLPGEKIAHIKETYQFIRFCKKHKVTEVSVGILAVFPGTPLWDIAVQRGKIIIPSDWEFFDANVFVYGSYKTPILLDDDVPIEEFKKMYFKMTQVESHRLIKHLIKRTLTDTPRLVRDALKNPSSVTKAMRSVLNKR